MSDARFPSVASDEGIEHLRGDEARSSNIAAARAVADMVRSTFGPRGLDKMLVSDDDSITITNDGETILKEVDVPRPGARILLEVARTQAEEVGDGTTTAVLIAGELLRAAEELIEAGLHPTVVVDGYQRAIDRFLADVGGLAERLDPDDEVLGRVAAASLNGKLVSAHAPSLASVILDATKVVTVDDTVDSEYLETVAKAGAPARESELRHGAAIDAEPCHESMPTDLPDAKVLLLQEDFAPPEPETKVKTSIVDAGDRERLVGHADRWIAETVEHLASLGVTAVFCDGRVDDAVVQLLSASGILAIEHVDRTDVEFEFLREVTDATPVVDPAATTRDSLGSADVSRDGLIYVENPDTHGVTLVLRGTTEPIAAEVERSVTDAINVVTQATFDGRVLPGGGAAEIELAARLRDHATSVDERTQLAIEAFADALEVVPATLARNAGSDPIDALVDLRAAHAAGRTSAGVNGETGAVDDMFDAGVIQPVHVTEQSVYNATKAAAILLKVDEVIVAEHSSYGDDDEEGESD